MNRREVLESAIKCVCHDRQDQHGNPEDKFAMIADMWEMYLCHKYGIDVSISPSDVGTMMNTTTAPNQNNFTVPRKTTLLRILWFFAFWMGVLTSAYLLGRHHGYVEGVIQATVECISDNPSPFYDRRFPSGPVL